MSISLEVYEHYYNGNGTTLGPHTIDFPFLASTDLIVIADGVQKAITTHYTVTPGSLLGSHYDGGTITFTAGNAPAVGIDNIYIGCQTAHTQGVSYSGVTQFSPTNFEYVMDRITLIARDAYGRAARIDTIATASATASAVAAASAAIASDVASVAANLVLTNADVVLTHADVVLTHADVVLTHADVVLTHADVVLTHADVVLTSADVLDAEAAAASASAIAAGDTSPYANTTGNFAAIDGARYWVDDAAQITLPAIAYNAGFVYKCKTQPPVTGITLIYVSGNPINGKSESVLIRNKGAITVKASSTSAWTAVKGDDGLLDRQSNSIKAKTANYTIQEADDMVVFTTSASGVTALLPAASTSTIHKKIKNSVSSTHSLIIDGAASETIDGVTTQTIPPGVGLTIQSDGTKWEII